MALIPKQAAGDAEFSPAAAGRGVEAAELQHPAGHGIET